MYVDMGEVHLPPIHLYRNQEERQLCLKKTTTTTPEIIQQNPSRKRLSLKRKQTPSSDQQQPFSKQPCILSQITLSLKNLLAQTSSESKMHASLDGEVRNTAISAPLQEKTNTTPKQITTSQFPSQISHSTTESPQSESMTTWPTVGSPQPASATPQRCTQSPEPVLLNPSILCSKQSLYCKYCAKHYSHKSSLSRHVSEAHGGEKGTIQCELCEKR